MRLYAEVQTPVRSEACQPANSIGTQWEDGERNGTSDCRDQSKRVKKVEAIVLPETFEMIRSELEEFSIQEISLTEVRICGRQDARKQFYRGAEYEVLQPKVKVEMLVTATDLADVIDAFSRASQATSASSEDRILINDVAEVIHFPRRPRVAQRQLSRSL